MLAHFNKEHGKPEDLTLTPAHRGCIKWCSSPNNDVLRLPDPDRCEVTEMPEFRGGNLRAFSSTTPRRSTPAASIYALAARRCHDWDDRRVGAICKSTTNT